MGRGAQRPIWHINESKKTGARSARAGKRGQNPLFVYIVHRCTTYVRIALQQIRPATHRNTEKERHLVEGIGREWGWGRSQMVRQRENLVLYKSFNTLWLVSTCLQFSLSRMSKMKTFRFKNKLRTESVQFWTVQRKAFALGSSVGILWGLSAGSKQNLKNCLIYGREDDSSKNLK